MCSLVGYSVTSRYEGQPCAGCGGNKGPKYKARKFCGHCKFTNKKVKSRNAHGKYLEKTYDITREEYDDCWTYQQGSCFFCRRATGRTRRLSVDHDHLSELVRGLLCRPCNNDLGHARDQLEYYLRGIIYLMDPPFQRMKRGAAPVTDTMVIQILEAIRPILVGVLNSPGSTNGRTRRVRHFKSGVENSG